jgi:hypothetical protein
MKAILNRRLLLGIFLLAMLFSVAPTHAQSGFEAGSYYSRQYYIQDVPVGYPYVKYDYWGRQCGRYQTWQRAQWHRESGGSYVMAWTSYGWQSQWVDGSYYWYEWINYERFIGY